jgi:phage terminase large subunit GpA-like protein
VAGKKIKGGLYIRTILVGFFKAELYSDLKKRRPTDEEMAQGWTFPPGYCHFPKGGKNYGDEHFRQLTAEQLITRTDKRGRTKREWAQSRPRNEALDCRIYARAAAWDLGMDRFQEKHWAALEKQLTVAPAKPQASPETPQPTKPVQPQREQKPRWIPKRDDWFKR